MYSSLVNSYFSVLLCEQNYLHSKKMVASHVSYTVVLVREEIRSTCLHVEPDIKYLYLELDDANLYQAPTPCI